MWWVATGAALLAAPGPAAAQGGTIAGTVTDSMSGEPLVGVDVTVRRAEAGASVVVRTDGAGAYRASPLQPGAYVVRFERAGWEPLEHTADVEAGTTLALSVRLVPRPFRILGVSTVARVRQPLLEAPASVSVLARDDLERQPQLTSSKPASSKVR
jgi:hypothetical protein